MLEKIKQILRNNFLTKRLKKTALEADSFTLYDLLALYISGISQGIFSTRAAAASWSLFFSLFPFLLFLFQVMPMLPHYDVIESLFYENLLTNILPKSVQTEVIDQVKRIAADNQKETITPLNWKAWSVLIFTIFVSGNGVSAIITGFNTSYHSGFVARPFWQQKLVAFFLTLFFMLLICVILLTLYYSNGVIRYMSESQAFGNQSDIVGMGLNFLVAMTAFFTGLVALYYFGTKVKGGIKRVLPGAMFTTFLFVFIFLGFNLYIDKFSTYSLVYGSIGVVMVIMLLLYVVVVLVLVGFELNATLANLRERKEKEHIKSMD